jgi:hypothetical protein
MKSVVIGRVKSAIKKQITTKKKKKLAIKTTKQQ